MQIRRVRSDSDFERLAGIWDSTLDHSSSKCIFFAFDWFRSWWVHLAASMTGETSELEVLVFQAEETAEDRRGGPGQGIQYGLAPLMRRGSSLYFLASHEVSDYCDFIFPRGQETRFFDALLAFLKRDLSGMHKLELINLPASSLTLEYLPQAAKAHGWVSEVEESEETPQLELPSDYETYVNSLPRRYRHELRRKVRRAGSLLELRTAKYVSPDDISSHMLDFIQIHKQSGHDKAGFWRKPGMEAFFLDTMQRFAEKGWLELRFLYERERAVAALLNFVYGEIISFYNMAFSRDFASYSPGYYLLDWSLRDAITGKLSKADFLRGAERYKYEFGAQKCKIYNLILERGVSSG